jgi:hypothetical protein
MLSSVSQVNEQFFALFSGIKIKDHGTGALIDVPVRYARKSAYDYTEEQENQVYPCIAIQDYAPTLRDEWWVEFKEYSGGLSDDELTAYLYRRPVWMDFRYDVSIAAKSYFQINALKDVFTRFMLEPSFLFNKSVIDDEDSVGDVVPFTVRITDVPRTDGVQEVNYEFTLQVWLYAVEPREVAVIQKVILNAEAVTVTV